MGREEPSQLFTVKHSEHKEVAHPCLAQLEGKRNRLENSPKDQGIGTAFLKRLICTYGRKQGMQNDAIRTHHASLKRWIFTGSVLSSLKCEYENLRIA